jgi:hypothetical protein
MDAGAEPAEGEFAPAHASGRATGSRGRTAPEPKARRHKPAKQPHREG